MPSDELWSRALIGECERRLFSEAVPRLKKCLGLLTEDEIWQRPNRETASVGNLTLHLCGNVRQYIIAGLGGAPDIRERDKEFNESGPLPAEQLLERLDATMEQAQAVLDSLPPARLMETHRVQGFTETGLSILIHVVEHFSYHVGEVTYFVKSNKAIDTGYYAGVDLSQTNAGNP